MTSNAARALTSCELILAMISNNPASGNKYLRELSVWSTDVVEFEVPKLTTNIVSYQDILQGLLRSLLYLFSVL
jgi:hypothetical protein